MEYKELLGKLEFSGILLKIFDSGFSLLTYVLGIYHITIGVGLMVQFNAFEATNSFYYASAIAPAPYWGIVPFICGLSSVAFMLIPNKLYPKSVSYGLIISSLWGAVFGATNLFSALFQGGAITAGLTYSFLASPVAFIVGYIWHRLGSLNVTELE